MGLFGGIKSRILHKKAESDINAVREQVLNEPRWQRTLETPEPMPRWRERTIGETRHTDIGNVGNRGFERPPEFVEDIPPELEPIGLQRQPEIEEISISKDKEDEILDRLAFMKSELSAIKSQIETVNERLKNIQRNMEGRY